MASDQMRFAYGDAVRVIDAAPSRFRLLTNGSIVGISTIATPAASELFGQPVGTPIYVIEDAKGASCEVPEPYLSKAGE